MLTFLEEILLLCLDDDSGRFLPILPTSMTAAAAGALLMDLALANRIDSDLDKLWVVDAKPTGERLLDDALVQLAAAPADQPVRFYLDLLARDGERYREMGVRRLVERGILAVEEGRLLWVFRTRRYPVLDGRQQREVKDRLLAILGSDEIPDPRDVVLICLSSACRIIQTVVGEVAFDEMRPRIEMLRKLDLIGQSVMRTVEEMEFVLATAPIQ